MTNRHLLLTSLFILLFAWRATAQFTPQGFNYQCIVRDNSGATLNNQTVTLLFTVRSGAPNGPVAYSEKQTTSTNEYGLINLIIGQGAPLQGAFNSISWGNGAKFLTVSVETSPNVFDELGSSQLMSVPYALYAQNTANSGDNWGTQVVQTSPPLSGAGTAGSPLALAQQGAQAGQALKWNGSAWAPQNDETGPDGTVTTINTGSGLTGGPVTTSGTISLANTPVSPGVYGSANQIPVIAVDQHGRITDVFTVPVPPNTIGITGAAGINVTQNGVNFTITNTGDIDAGDDITTASQADGDVNGPFSNLQIKANAVGNAELADNAVGNTELTDNAVGNAELADNVVNIAELSNGAVTAAKLNNMGATSGQVLKWNGSAWAPAADNAGITNLTGGAGISITGASPNLTVINTGDTDGNDDLTTVSVANGDVSGPFSNLQIKPDAVGASELAGNAVTTPKINAGAVTGDKIAQMSAANGQVLKWNGASWAPAADNLGSVTITGGVGIDVIGSANNYTIANGGDVNPFDDLTTASQADGDLTGPFSNLQIKQSIISSFELANNAVTGVKINAGAVTGDKIAQMSATTGQVLKWNGTAWAPAVDGGGDNWGTQFVQTGATLTGTGTTGSPLNLSPQSASIGQVLKFNGTTWVPQNDALGGADNWGTQTAQTNFTLIGNGTVGNELGLAPQGALPGQVLKFTNGVWTPQDDAVGAADNWGAQVATTNATLTGDGANTPLGIAAQNATNGQVLKFNGSTWAPANEAGGDDWGTQTAKTNFTLIGNGTVGNELGLAPQNAANGQVLKFDGAVWIPQDDEVGAGDDWGAQVATTNATLTGDGANTPLGIAAQGATNGQVLKFDGNTWVPQDDNTGSGPADNWGTGSYHQPYPEWERHCWQPIGYSATRRDQRPGAQIQRYNLGARQ
ncbi:MAG: hypothetical protein IPH12_07930 [Saprospirales bacterium]|nr:hypothetical protein [Saprospirales bacterium]